MIQSEEHHNGTRKEFLEVSMYYRSTTVSPFCPAGRLQYYPKTGPILKTAPLPAGAHVPYKDGKKLVACQNHVGGTKTG